MNWFSLLSTNLLLMKRNNKMKNILKNIFYIILIIFLLWGIFSYIDIVIQNLDNPTYSKFNLIYLLYDFFHF